jgi:hypothetical protein
MPTTIEKFVQVTYEVTLWDVEPDVRTVVGEALAANFTPTDEVQRRITLWFPADEYRTLSTQAASKQAANRARRLAERDANLPGLRLQARDWNVERCRERLLDVEVERDDEGKILNRRPARGVRR